MIKVIHIQISTIAAAGVALRLNNALSESNIDSSFLALHPSVNDSEKIIHLGKIPKIISMLDRMLRSFILRNSNKQFGLFSYPILGTNVSRIKQVKEADIIYLHWIQGGFLNLKNIYQLAKLKKPIIFFMHDMWTITGGCHHSFSCEKYKSRCNDCQIFSKHKKNDWSAMEFDRKLKLYNKFDNIYLLSPSKWLRDCASQSQLTINKPIFYIPNSVDNKIFKPFDKNIAKQILNLNVNDTVIAFGAVSIGSPYKGWAYLQRALEILKYDDDLNKISVLIFGDDYSKQVADEIPFNTKFMGYLRDGYSLSLVYNAADVFVAPSLADNLPTTLLESLSCGTPVVGFDVGGIPDMIKHKENGYLAKYRDAEDLANGIKFCLKNNIKGQLLPDFEMSNIIEKHLELINSIKS